MTEVEMKVRIKAALKYADYIQAHEDQMYVRAIEKMLKPIITSMEEKGN